MKFYKKKSSHKKIIYNTDKYKCYVHTYTHNMSLQPFTLDYDLASHTTYVVCTLILYMSGGICSLRSTPNNRLFEKFYMVILFILRAFCQKSAET